MVLSFALCATVAFAQSNKLATKTQVADKIVTAEAVENERPAVGYTGSIFTKDGEFFTCSFAAGSNYTTGTIGNNEMVNGTNATPHAQTKVYSMWQRLPDSTAASIEGDAFFGQTNYPVSYDVLASYARAVYGNTPEDGLMFMSMQDQITDWGGFGDIGGFDAYIKFGPFATPDCRLTRVRFAQYYRAFNDDHCWLDYSLDGTTWYAVEINRSRIDVAVNGATRGWKSVSMPIAMANKTSVWMRIRWEVDGEGNGGGAYGYVWLLDDFSVSPAPMNTFNFTSNQYYEGFYQMMPQNLQVPVVWVNELANDGQNDQTNVTGYVYAGAAESNATLLASKNIHSMPMDPNDTRAIIIDPLAWYDSVGRPTSDGGIAHGEYDYDYIRTNDPYVCLPTTNEGQHYFFSDITTDLITPHIGAIGTNSNGTFDTIRYDVNWNDEGDHPFGVWARDHGVIRRNSYYVAGMIRAGTFSTNPTGTPAPMWNKAGYGVFVTYVTGDSIPRDANGNPWRVLGMEMVASTYPNYQEVGARIEPQLRYEFTDSVGDGYIGSLNHGASVYTIKSTDVLSAAYLTDETEATGLQYETYGNYPVIRIMFPNQPELYSNLSFAVGYRLAEDADFAVATSSDYYYKGTSTAYFYNTPEMESYGTALTMFNKGSVMVYDPYDTKFHAFNTNEYPMIRMLVGPGYYVPKVAITLECENEDLGGFIDGNFGSLCGQIDSVAIGGSASYTVMPQPGYVIDKVYLDGAEIEYEEQTDDADGRKYGTVHLDNVTAAHTLSCSFKEAPIGFDPVANNVVMRLQPNPATSMVRISLKNVNGNVNMSLIDMSGRVVTTSQFNAENGTTINVSNLAKGAYFVRITNNKFTKIEKLIVR